MWRLERHSDVQNPRVKRECDVISENFYASMLSLLFRFLECCALWQSILQEDVKPPEPVRKVSSECVGSVHPYWDALNGVECKAQ